MRTNELHASPKQVQRSDGRGAVRSAAYRSASRLYDERTGLWHDYRRKQGVEHTRIYTPDNAPDWAQDRGKLWNAVEAKENRKNSMTAREWEIAFPHEFNAMQRREAGDAIARELMRRYGCAVDIAYHLPDRKGDERNFHAHILYTTRGFDENTKDGWAKNKYRDLSQDKITVDGQQTTRASREVLSMREFMAGEMNRIAARERIEVKTEHLSFKERGLDKEPTVKLGPAAAEMERKGEKTDRGDINRDIQEANDNREELKTLQQKAKVIDLAIEREKRRIAKEQKREAEQKAWTRKEREKKNPNWHHAQIKRDQERARKAAFFDAQRKEKIQDIKDFYEVENRKSAMDAAYTNLAQKQGFFARVFGRTRRAAEEAEAQRRNFEDAARKQTDAINAINIKYHYREPVKEQTPAPEKPRFRRMGVAVEMKREEARAAPAPSKEAWETAAKAQAHRAANQPEPQEPERKPERKQEEQTPPSWSSKQWNPAQEAKEAEQAEAREEWEDYLRERQSNIAKDGTLSAEQRAAALDVLEQENQQWEQQRGGLGHDQDYDQSHDEGLGY